MADWNGFKKNGTTYIPNDATARQAITAIEGKIPSSASSSNKMATAEDVASRVDWESYAKTGAVNEFNWNTVGKTENNVTFTVNADKSVTVSTTAEGASADTTLNLKTYTAAETLALNGKYLSGCPSGGGNDKFRLVIQRNESPWSPFANDTGNGAVAINSISAPSVVYIRVMSGQKITTPITFKPMIADNPNAVYAPYAMTNQQLTEQKANKIDTANVVARADVAANTSFTFNGENGHSYIVLGDHPYNNNGFMSIVDLFTSAGSVTDIKTAASVTVTQSNNVITVAVTSGVWVKIIDLGYFK